MRSLIDGINAALSAPLGDARDARILDFDIEVRPMAFYGGDFTTGQPTAIAWSWIGEGGHVECRVIGESYDTRQTMAEEVAMLEDFRAAYDAATIVTGHYIRGFDLSVLSGRMMRHGLPLLDQKLTQDTKGDLARASKMSKSQENLGAMFELHHPKIPMNTTAWEEANALTPEGIETTRTRVIGDVRQHVEMRQWMIDKGYLGRARSWYPNGGNVEAYVP